MQLELDIRSTALVLIDLQDGILSTPTAPHSVASVVSRADGLAKRFRAEKAPVVLVRVGWSADMGDAPRQPADQPMLPAGGKLPSNWMDFADGLEVRPSDILIVKRHWGAFTGTELDLQLRRRGIGTIVLGGVATNFGVESTARSGWELGYAVVLAEDATGARSDDAHRFAVETVFPRLGRVRKCAEIVAAMTLP